MKHPLHYEILREIGRGGMASVHEAMHVPLYRRVAIKVMLPQLAADPKSVARFEREARLASSVRHPHIVEIFDFGTVDRVPFLVMELLVGETLAARLANGKAMAIEEAVAFVLPIASAVAHAHTMGIVHRDLKPANVFLTEGIARRPWPKILDFGISKRTSTAIESMREGLTSAASMVGTLSYMAPEQIQDAGTVTAKTDQYALAVMLYECVTGRLPFFGASPYQLMHNILNGSITAPSALVPQLPAHFDAILLRALERDPANRYPSVHAFASLLLGFGGRETCAQWASEFACAAEAGGRTQNGDALPSPDVEARPRAALRQGHERRWRRVAFAIGVGAGLLVLGVLVVVTRLRAPRLLPDGDASTAPMSEPSINAPGVAVPLVVPLGARSGTMAAPPETPATETPSTETPPALPPARPRTRASATPKPGEKMGESAPNDPRDSKPVNPLRPTPAETPASTRPGVGTNEAPIFE
jgi:serine/threonine-protein kinase